MPGPTPEAESTAETSPDTPVVNSGLNRYKPCALCLRVISVFDTSAGCQDPTIGAAKGCDRLAAVEADVTASGSVTETPAAGSETDSATESVVSELEDAVAKLENQA